METEDNLQRYGTPLEPLEEDEVPSKKPITVEEQIVTDENGKRRFHGAFTGGFSAGFWNTVGSLEGWTPQSFKSSRTEKATEMQKQRPEDFMDDEDLGEFGIAPQRVQAREDFVQDDKGNRKRKFLQPSAGSIPGVPVLQQLLKPVKDKVAVRILKSMGWRPGQGIGPRQTRKQKKESKKRNERELYLMQRYGCDINEQGSDSVLEKPKGSDESEVDEDEDDDDEITFAPDDYEPYFCTIKTNRYGLGYTGLNRTPVLSKSTISIGSGQHFNLFGPLEVVDKNNKKLSITGQAFGVGALEEEDEDVYARDDMSKYDFSLENKKHVKKVEKIVQNKKVIDGFDEATKGMQKGTTFILDLPIDFRPRNWLERRTRFAPLDPVRAQQINIEKNMKKSGLGRHDMNPEQRTQLLNEEPAYSKQNKAEHPITSEKETTSSLKNVQDNHKKRNDKTLKLLEQISAKSSSFTSGGVITSEGEEKNDVPNIQIQPEVQKENENMIAKVAKKSESLGITQISGEFKPFISDQSKQNRYEEFLAANLRDEDEITEFLRKIQPLQLSEFDREMEKKEFIQARKIYKPNVGLMFDKFISEAALDAEKQANKITKGDVKKIIIERTKTMWKPNALLCKRFNVPEPFGGKMVEEKQPQKPKISIFDYLEGSINTKANFETPVIIPKGIDKPKPMKEQNEPSYYAETDISLYTQTPKIDVIDQVEIPITENKSISQQVGLATNRTVNPPKTELERKVIETKNKPASEKVELFKAIFEDSDDENEDDDDSKECEESTKIADEPQTIFTKPNSSAALNLLRNNSPPRGIFAMFFNKLSEENEKDIKPDVTNTTNTTNTTTSTISEVSAIGKVNTDKITFKSKSERMESSSSQNVEESDFYGPKIPDRLKKLSDSDDTHNTSIDEKILQHIMNRKMSKYEKNIVEEWVEKSNCSDTDTNSSSSTISSDISRHKKKSKKTKKSKSKEHKKQKKRDKKKLKKSREKSHKS
ncbi:G patch domain-containing protein 1 homolog, partial [Teleopsis dalmanni]|uniref:G patch domain-containing protein 1 homolog n=1 Tax=Teleopsis dalmanni TaxID=139649 RepID=UPI0018CF7158